MDTTQLGKTGLTVSQLGFGLAQIGALQGTDGVRDAGRLLSAALDGGINFLDTSACYGNSEELIGSTVAHRREEYVLATKCGHAVGGSDGQPWTAQTVEESIDRSLRRLRTDYVDLVQLHSCETEILEKGQVIEALLRAKESGKTRFVGYSGHNEPAHWAVESGVFDTLQTTLNLVDQQGLTRLLKPASAKGMGLIIKRPIAIAVWGVVSRPSASTTEEEYLTRAKRMVQLGPIPGAPEDAIELALGFVFAHREVDTAIVGSRTLSHLLSNLDLVERGVSIPSQTLDELHSRFAELGKEWTQR